jgi:surface antigen
MLARNQADGRNAPLRWEVRNPPCPRSAKGDFMAWTTSTTVYGYPEMSTACIAKRSAWRTFAGAVACTITATVASIAAAQAPGPAIARGDSSQPTTGLDLTLYLRDSERSLQAAALDQASRAPIGTAVGWTDPQTHAAGRIVPLQDAAGSAGAGCRDYRVTIDVPRRDMTMWTRGIGPVNNSSTIPMSMPMSPAFTREFVTQACRTPVGLASAPRR